MASVVATIRMEPHRTEKTPGKILPNVFPGDAGMLGNDFDRVFWIENVFFSPGSIRSSEAFTSAIIRGADQHGGGAHIKAGIRMFFRVSGAMQDSTVRLMVMKTGSIL